MMLLKTSATPLRDEDEERALYDWRMSFMSRWVSVNLKDERVFMQTVINRRGCPVSQTQRWGDRRKRQVDKTQKLYQSH